MLSKKVKLKLDYNQELIINTLSNEHRLLYNYLLGEVKKGGLDFRKINENYKHFRSINSLTINSKSSQNTSISLINNIKSYFSLKKKDKTAKFPYKFKSFRYFKSFMLDYNKGNGGFKIKDGKLELNLNSIRNKLIIDLPNYVNDISGDNIKTITFTKQDGDYYLCFVYQETSKKIELNKDNYLSIDLGYSSLIVGASNKGNVRIENFKQKKLQTYIEGLQSRKDRYKKGSRKYNKVNKTFKKYKRKLSNKQRDFQHKSSKNVIDYCIQNNIGKLIIGDLQVKKVIRKENWKINGLSKSTGLGRFKTYLTYKGKNVGIETVLINEAYTSKINCLTGLVEFDSGLDNRTFLYNGIEMDRDLNSAINILIRSGLCLTQDSKLNLLLNNISKIKVY